MRALILTPAFPPEITGSGHLYYELTASLAASGHAVTVITALPRQRMGDQKLDNRYRGKLLMRETMVGAQVIRPATLPLPLSVPLMKGLDHFSIAFSYLMAGLVAGKQQVVLAYSPPLTFGLAAFLLSRKNRIPFVLNVQDIFPQYAIDAGLLRNPMLIRQFRALESFLYRHADCITVHSERNREYLVSKGVPASKVVTIPNWADVEFYRPGPSQNVFRSEHGFQNEFIVSYAGTMGWAQGLDAVLQAAELLRDEKRIQFVLVGDGPRRRDLQARAAAAGLQNVTFLPLQPRDKYPLLIQASDVCLISLNQRLSTPVVPGKLFDIMACGRPVVGNVPLGGDAPAIVNAARCGICVESDRADQLAEAILKLYREPSLAEEMGANGRRYAESHFSRPVCTGAYEQLLKELCDKHGGKVAYANSSAR